MYDIQKLVSFYRKRHVCIYLVFIKKEKNLDALHPNWIRIQSSVQMKIVTEEEIPWREYYVVLAVGYLLIYKEGLSKSTRVKKKIYSFYYVSLIVRFYRDLHLLNQ